MQAADCWWRMACVEATHIGDAEPLDLQQAACPALQYTKIMLLRTLACVTLHPKLQSQQKNSLLTLMLSMYFSKSADARSNGSVDCVTVGWVSSGLPVLQRLRLNEELASFEAGGC